MTEREETVVRLLRLAGLTPNMVGIGRDDDVVWAKFSVGSQTQMLNAPDADNDEEAVAEIVRQARELGIL